MYGFLIIKNIGRHLHLMLADALGWYQYCNYCSSYGPGAHRCVRIVLSVGTYTCRLQMLCDGIIGSLHLLLVDGLRWYKH